MFQKSMINIFLVFITSFLIYFLSLYSSNIFGVNSILLIRDLAQTCNTSIWVGLISNIGVLLWAFAAAINIFVSNIISSNHLTRKFILFGGLFSFI